MTAHEALAIGMSRSTLYRRVRDGVFVRVGPGVFVLPGTATRPDVAFRAAGRTIGAVVSHQSAARIHRMQPIPKSPPTVTVSHRGSYNFPGLVVHQCTDLLNEHIMEIDGLRVTTEPRTIIDLAKVLKRARLESVVDHALAAGLDLDELLTFHQTLSRQGKSGMKGLGEILVERVGELAIPETELEYRIRRLLESAGRPPPIRQFRAPWLKPINGRVDLAYPDKEIVIEGDSRRWHLLADAFETDRHRDNAAALAGWIVLRVTWKMVIKEPMKVVSMVRTALETR